MKLLVLDIETRPNLAYVWGLWQQNVNIQLIEEEASMLCWAAKWVGKHKVTFRSVHDDGKEDMLQDLWGLLNEADAVIHYNGRRFDIPHINREFLEAEMDPPSPYKQIDLLATAKRRFKFPSNKLEFIVNTLDIGSKLKHEGFDLWVRCMAGEASAWKLMRQYNVHDVALTELLYERLKPWLYNVPSFAAHEQERVCPACGSKDLQPRGYSYTQQSQYRRYVCADCGKWSRDTKATRTINLREVAD